VALTVTDIEKSRPWYESLIGNPPVIDEDTGSFRHVVWLLGGRTLVGLHQFPDPHGSDPFDERKPGMDHLAFGCADRAELEEWASKLDELGIANGGIVDASYGSGLSFLARRWQRARRVSLRQAPSPCNRLLLVVAESRSQSRQVGHRHGQRRMTRSPQR
jgi:catechol 2,3-dioxygenase-like lactoylglutathione lyase family enzyme